jgi:Aerotolerance regulator N-terminal
VFTALHPLLLWGATAVAVPILIHLLLRQRPRPRPWAAMRWLLAAAQAAQRRYRLTNLLLLLLRCLIVLLLALAVSRPTVAGFGGGERLVLIIDRTASMSARGNDPGPLAIAKASLSKAELSYRTVVVVAVSDKVEALASTSPSEAMAAIARLEASELPGGLDHAAGGANADSLTALVGSGADAVLISDFQQDDGELLAALLRPRVRSLARWRVGSPCGNAMITGVERLDDLRPGQPGELVVRLLGAPKAVALSADDGPFLPVSGPPSGGLLRVTTPPLSAGDHRLRVRLEDDGLAYDNILELPVTVRPQVHALVVSEGADFLSAALHADEGSLTSSSVRPAQFPAEPLPPRGLVALRGTITDSVRLRDWVLSGGVLWSSLELLNLDPTLRELVKDVVSHGGNRAGGDYSVQDQDLNEAMHLDGRQTVPDVALPASAEVLLRAGEAPLVVALPVGRGWLIIELAPLAAAADNSLVGRGTTPLWISRMARRYTARLGAPRYWQAGLAAPQAIQLRRGGTAVSVRAGEALLLAPGAWSSDDGAVVVLPSISEGQLEKAQVAGTVLTLEAALPSRPGIDWGLPLAVAALLIALTEGLVAAWAGRAYGA